MLALCLRRGWLVLKDAQLIMDAALRAMEGREYGAPSDRVLRLAGDSACSACDCEFVALAKELRVPPVTVDRQLLKAFPSDTVPLSRYVDPGGAPG